MLGLVSEGSLNEELWVRKERGCGVEEFECDGRKE